MAVFIFLPCNASEEGEWVDTSGGWDEND